MPRTNDGTLCIQELFERSLRHVVVFGGLVAGRLVSLALDGGITGYGDTIRSLFFLDAIGFARAAVTLAFAIRDDAQRSIAAASERPHPQSSH